MPADLKLQSDSEVHEKHCAIQFQGKMFSGLYMQLKDTLEQMQLVSCSEAVNTSEVFKDHCM